MSSAKEHRRKLFTSIGQEPLMWLEQAQELKLCGDMMWGDLLAIKNVSQVLQGIRIKKLALVNSYMLLTGFAFENIIKGILIAQNSALVTGNLSGSIKSHDLTTLAATAKINLNSTQDEFLRRLQEFTTWAGRYPITLDAHRYADSEKYLKLSSADVKLADQLFQDFETILRSERAKNPPPFH